MIFETYKIKYTNNLQYEIFILKVLKHHWSSYNRIVVELTRFSAAYLLRIHTIGHQDFSATYDYAVLK